MTDNSKCCGLPLADSGYCVNNPWHVQAAETTDPEIPDSLVDVGVAGIGTMETQIPSLSTFQAQAVVRAVLAAALPHLRPLFEVGTDDAAARWALLYSDAVDNGNELAQELRQDLKVATQVGLELGRQAAGEELEELFRGWADLCGDPDTREALFDAATAAHDVAEGRKIDARDTGKGDS